MRSAPHRRLAFGLTLITLGCGGSPESDPETAASADSMAVEDGQVRAGAAPLPAVGAAAASTVRELACGHRGSVADTTVTIGSTGGTIRLRQHRLSVAPGVVPPGPGYQFRLREHPDSLGWLIGERSPGPLGSPTGGSPRFVLRLNYQGCQDPRNATMILWREGGEAYPGQNSAPRAWIEVHMDRFGSTYAAAAPG